MFRDTTRDINDEAWYDTTLDFYLGRDLAKDAYATLQQAGSEGHVYRGDIPHSQWVDAQYLKTGYRLFNPDNTWAIVTSVQVTDEPLTAYNLTVADYHTYFVAGQQHAPAVWVHNDCSLALRNAGISPEDAALITQRLEKSPYKAQIEAYIASGLFNGTEGYKSLLAQLKNVRNNFLQHTSVLQTLKAAERLQQKHPNNPIVFEKTSKGDDIDLAVLNKDGTMLNAIQLKSSNFNKMLTNITSAGKQIKNANSQVKTVDVQVSDITWKEFENSAQYTSLLDRMTRVPVEKGDGLKGISISITFSDGVTKQW